MDGEAGYDLTDFAALPRREPGYAATAARNSSDTSR
jgi:hypothetical protein